jgi:3-methylfumaryl-CoA hydratase
MDDARWQAWVGKEEHAEDVIDANRANALRATLESRDEPFAAGAALPELWHWCYFWSLAGQSALGPDGHAARGEFLPPIDLPRRMWAGSRLTWHRPLRIGETVERQSRIADIKLKEGRSGRIAFVTVSHRILGPQGLALEEEHDIAYRAPAPASTLAGAPARPATPAPAEMPWQRRMTPDPVLLFRYSALTFNGHRIHYDQPYVTGGEGYPGLIVHGPLLATLMVDLARREAPGRRLAAFRFRALSPLFDTAPFTVAGRPAGAGAALWVRGPAGETAMQGEVTFA